jgi:hypothetical protein
MLPPVRPYALIGLLLASCASDTPPLATTKTLAKKYDLGAITVLLPSAWKALDYDSSGLWGAKKGPTYRQRHLFLNTAALNTTLRETIVLTVEQRPAIPQAQKAAQALATNLRAFPEQLQGLTLRDTLLANGKLAIIEATYRNPKVGMDIIQTYAFYTRANTLVSFMGTARSHPGPANQQTWALFRQAITSITWK